MPAIITRGAASAKAFGWTGGKVVVGQQAYTTAGTYSWVAPAGVTKVSYVLIGGGGRAGGGLAYCNYCVTPGSSYAVVVGAGASANASSPGGTSSAFASTATGGQIIGGQGNHGLCQGVGGFASTAGGGAAGYTGNGGSAIGCAPTAGTGGGGGGGFRVFCGAYPANFTYKGAGGGGVGILGAGSNGAAGTSGSLSGKGGSGGANGAIPATWCTGASATGGLYGGGGGYGGSCSNFCACIGGYTCSVTYWGTGAAGAARIIWPGNVRFYPSTRTADE